MICWHACVNVALKQIQQIMTLNNHEKFSGFRNAPDLVQELRLFEYAHLHVTVRAFALLSIEKGHCIQTGVQRFYCWVCNQLSKESK